MIRIHGTIADPSGRSVPGAMIELRAINSTSELLIGAVLTIKCDTSGKYDFQLGNGFYDVYAQNDYQGDMDYIGTGAVYDSSLDSSLYGILVDGGVNLTPPMLADAYEAAKRAVEARDIVVREASNVNSKAAEVELARKEVASNAEAAIAAASTATMKANEANNANTSAQSSATIASDAAKRAHDLVDTATGGMLLKSMNLSDVPDATAARKNLGIPEVVYSEHAPQPEIPFPDVWIPLNDGLQMLAGYGEEVKVGDFVVSKRARFSRNTIGSYIDKSGLMQIADVNEPRFEKNGILLEGSSTNLVTNGGDPSQWYLSGVTRVMDGDAALLTSTIGAYPRAYIVTVAGYPTSVGDAYTASVLVKPGNTNFCHLTFDILSYTYRSKIDLIKCEEVFRYVSTPSRIIATANVVKMKDGWVRVCLTLSNLPEATIGSFYVGPMSESATEFDHAGVGYSIYAKKAQIEKMMFATSYIPTTSAAATRSSDMLTIPLQGNYDQRDITIAAEVSLSSYSAVELERRIFDMGEPSGVGGRFMLTVPNGSNTLRFIAGNISETASVTLPDKKFVCTVVASGAALGVSAVNHYVMEERTVDYVNGGTHIAIGSDLLGLNQMFGNIRNLRIWLRPLSESQRKAIS